MQSPRSQALQDILAFYAEAGVDTCMDDVAADRLSDPEMHSIAGNAPEGGAPSSSLRPPLKLDRPGASMGSAMQASSQPLASPDEAVMAARAAAKSAASLDDLRAILDRFEGCALRMTAKQLVFADGNPKAKLMFVGEAPGRDEDIQGLPFVGVSGKLLDRMLQAIGYDRHSVYIANIVPWRPPGNRTPTPQEAAICLPFILRQIELVDPDVMVCLGGPSAQTLLNIKDGIRKARGRWMDFETGTRTIRAIATFHPAYLLRQPLEKRFAWRDFLAVKKALAPA